MCAPNTRIFVLNHGNTLENTKALVVAKMVVFTGSAVAIYVFVAGMGGTAITLGFTSYVIINTKTTYELVSGELAKLVYRGEGDVITPQFIVLFWATLILLLVSVFFCPLLPYTKIRGFTDNMVGPRLDTMLGYVRTATSALGASERTLRANMPRGSAQIRTPAMRFTADINPNQQEIETEAIHRQRVRDTRSNKLIEANNNYQMWASGLSAVSAITYAIASGGIEVLKMKKEEQNKRELILLVIISVIIAVWTYVVMKIITTALCGAPDIAIDELTKAREDAVGYKDSMVTLVRQHTSLPISTKKQVEIFYADVDMKIATFDRQFILHKYVYPAYQRACSGVALAMLMFVGVLMVGLLTPTFSPLVGLKDIAAFADVPYGNYIDTVFPIPETCCDVVRAHGAIIVADTVPTCDEAAAALLFLRYLILPLAYDCVHQNANYVKNGGVNLCDFGFSSLEDQILRYDNGDVPAPTSSARWNGIFGANEKRRKAIKYRMDNLIDAIGNQLLPVWNDVYGEVQEKFHFLNMSVPHTEGRKSTYEPRRCIDTHTPSRRRHILQNDEEFMTDTERGVGKLQDIIRAYSMRVGANLTKWGCANATFVDNGRWAPVSLTTDLVITTAPGQRVWPLGPTAHIVQTMADVFPIIQNFAYSAVAEIADDGNICRAYDGLLPVLKTNVSMCGTETKVVVHARDCLNAYQPCFVNAAENESPVDYSHGMRAIAGNSNVPLLGDMHVVDKVVLLKEFDIASIRAIDVTLKCNLHDNEITKYKSAALYEQLRMFVFGHGTPFSWPYVCANNGTVIKPTGDYKASLNGAIVKYPVTAHEGYGNYNPINVVCAKTTEWIVHMHIAALVIIGVLALTVFVWTSGMYWYKESRDVFLARSMHGMVVVLYPIILVLLLVSIGIVTHLYYGVLLAAHQLVDEVGSNPCTSYSMSTDTVGGFEPYLSILFVLYIATVITGILTWISYLSPPAIEEAGAVRKQLKTTMVSS